MQFRVMMFYDFKQGISYDQCHQTLVRIFGEDAPSKSQVNFWYNEFKRGRHSFEDEPRSGRPVDVVTSDKIERARQLIKEHRNITYRELEAELGISSPSVAKILHENLGVRKVASRWIPHLLSDMQKQDRVNWCKFMLKKFENGQSRRVDDIITGDETWIYSYDPETKQQSTVWMFEDEVPPTKVVRGKSTSKKMVAIFFRRAGLIAAVPLEERRTVNAEWYSTVCLPKVFTELENERPHTGLRGIMLHHDNAPAHTAADTLDFLHDRRVQLVTHPAYSPDLAPCDFFLFPTVKKSMRGKRFVNENEAIAAMNDVLRDLPKKAYQECFEKWFSRMHMCIDAGGEYFEKL